MLTPADIPAWLRAVVLIGAPAVIAIYLTYFVTADLREDVQATQRLLTLHTTEQAQFVDRVETLIREQARTNALLAESSRLLQQLCLQSATDATDRRACLGLPR